ncbi:DUF1127 domain-containing protein [Denitrobaculum tricleocarpae]|uniref:DUF1127 domain-containing protein n=1 Tax=Denitrobaculum tricleocarpae TaxID=2591009 RepID=A0A545T0W0_9PROT|nr:DUF1127 domain-containing protein [Denitrobaculum tricleocarpae]TQV70819.1 DUF1127 domain-containing protein [Denitrobaculum tricleocarpae]
MPYVNASKEFDAANQPHDLEWMMVDTRRRQSEAARKLAAKTSNWCLRATGLAVFGRVVKTALVNPLRVAMLRRRTLANLQQLDDRLLADIGIERTMIPTVVKQLVSRDNLSAGSVDHPATAHNPLVAGDIELVKSVGSVAPKAAANSNRTSHRAA